MKAFNPKIYQGKPRVYTSIKGTCSISRLWVWQPDLEEYSTPLRGNAYEAYRYELVNGTSARIKKTFRTLEAARAWQANRHPIETKVHQVGELATGPTLQEITNEWRRRTKDQYQSSTLDQYEVKLRLYFQDLMPLSIYEITPQRIDHWIEQLKDPNGKGMKRSTRLHFDHELDILGIILGYYREYYDDPKFQFPIKKRHRKASKLNRKSLAKRKDLTEAELGLFTLELSRIRGGQVFAAMAIIQYWHALRVSEVAALHWEDVTLDDKQPEESMLRVRRKVCYPRKRGSKPYVEAGFKNDNSNNGSKDLPITPESYEALRGLHHEGAKGLIFKTREGGPIPYRTIQYYFNKGFKNANLPFSATHVMRHGGCRAIYNSTNGNKHLAGELLGNSSVVDTYAKSYRGNLREWVRARWEQNRNTKP